jgi:hypothetical protein
MKQYISDLLSISEAKDLINNTELSFRHPDCATCECYLGYIAQLEIDSDPESQQYLKLYKPDRDQIHSLPGECPRSSRQYIRDIVALSC